MWDIYDIRAYRRQVEINKLKPRAKALPPPLWHSIPGLFVIAAGVVSVLWNELVDWLEEWI